MSAVYQQFSVFKCSNDFAFQFPFPGSNKRKNANWRSPRAAVIPNFHLPMRSSEVKNRTSVEEIKSLRLITAIKTPYLPDGRFDLEAYDALVNMQIEDGVEGVIVGGTTGEGQLMGWDEHIMLIGHTVNCFGGLIKVIGNTGSNSTREAIHATEQGFAVGMHAALHINPYYGKTSLEGLISHFDSVLPMGPTIIYNVPSRTGQDVPPRVIHTLVQSPNMAGVKECVGNDRVEQYTSKDIVVWSGNDDECHDSRWIYGATGVISVTSNLVPLLAKGFSVKAGVRDMDKAKTTFPGNNPNLQFVKTDVTEGSAKLADAISDDSEAVICATGFQYSWDLFAPWKVDNFGTVNLVDACRKRGVNRFILISSILVNGAAMGQQLNPAYIFLNAFGLTLVAKLQAEQYIRKSGINYTVIRPGGLRNDPPKGNVIMEPEDTLYEGSISRDQVAEVAVEALLHRESYYKVVEIVAQTEAPKRSFEELFSSIK